MSNLGPPAWVAEPLSWIGMRWPDGDPARLSMMSEDWLRYSGKLWEHWWNGDQTSEDVLRHNSGDAMEAFRHWWSRPGGPKENLNLSQVRAENIAAALRAVSTQVTIMQVIFIAELYALVIAIALIAKAVAAGGVIGLVGQSARKAAEEKTKSSLGAAVFKLVGLMVAGGAIWKLFLEPHLGDGSGSGGQTGSPYDDTDEEPEPQAEPGAAGGAAGGGRRPPWDRYSRGETVGPPEAQTDGSGKVHGGLPNPSEADRRSLEDQIYQLRTSIRTREEAMRYYGEDHPQSPEHRDRLGDERRLLRQLEQEYEQILRRQER